MRLAKTQKLTLQRFLLLGGGSLAGMGQVGKLLPVLALLGVYIVGTLLHRSDIALVVAWCATMCDMTVRMTLMIRRYRSEKWHTIRV